MPSCASFPASNQTQGAVAEGAIGALIGSTSGGGRGTVWAPAAGAIGGALAGSSIGQRLDSSDRRTVQTASSSKYYKNRNYGYRSNRGYYRGNRYYRGGRSYYRGNRYYGNRYRSSYYRY